MAPVIDINNRPPSPADLKGVLERFTLDEDLARLEKLTSQFNIFEAVGMIRQEIRHSNLLAWLLNPAQNHGLGDSFLKGLLRQTGIKSKSRIDVDTWDLSATEVRREWKHIDITLVDQSNKFVCVIENKVDSGERINQLCDYRKVVLGEFPDYTHHYVLLNVTGELPSDREYVGVTYDDVCEVIESALKTGTPTIDNDVATALTHYVAMIRRHIMPDDEIQQLCRRIYRKHQAALDLIYEHRPDLQALIRDALVEIIKADSALTLDGSTDKSHIRFFPTSWDKPELRRADNTSRYKTNMMVNFSFLNSVREKPNMLRLRLTLRQGDEDVRRRLWDAAVGAGSPFTPDPEGLPSDWPALFWKDIIGTAEWEDLEDSLDFERIQLRLQEVWSALKSNELPRMIEVIDRLFP